MPTAENDSDSGRSVSEPGASKAHTVRKLHDEMDKILKSADIQTEDDFQKEGEEVLSRLLKEYEMKAKVKGADRNEIEIALNKEFGRYTEKFNSKLGELNKNCDRLAATRCRNFELELSKKMESCSVAEEMTMLLAEAAEQACKTYPPVINNYQLRNRYRRQVREGMERVEENLTNQINAKRLELRNSGEKRKPDGKIQTLAQRNDAGQKACQEVRKMRQSYDAMMKERIGGISHEEHDIQLFHEECDKELQDRLSKSLMPPYLGQLTRKEWSSESVKALIRIKNANADFWKNDSEECAKVNQDCMLLAESLSVEEWGQSYFEGEELEEKLRKIKRKAFDKFQEACPTCALSISRKSKELLEEYLKKDFVDLVRHRNEINKKSAMEEVNALEKEMKKKCKMVFNEMLRGSSAGSERILLIRGTTKNKLEDLIDQKASSSLVKRKCRERIDPILEDEHQLYLLSKEQEKNQRSNAENALKSRCLTAYRQTMDKLLRETDNVEQSDRQAQRNVSAILNREDSSSRAAVYDEILQKMRNERGEYLRKERQKKEKGIEDQRRIVEHFQKSLQNKLGDVSCSPRRLQECERLALAEVEDSRKKLRIDLQMETAVALQKEIEKARVLSALKNAIFDQECQQRLEPSVEEFKELARRSLDRFVQDSNAFEIAKEMHVQRFCQNVRGNPDVIEEYRSKLRQALKGLTIQRRVEPNPLLTVRQQIWVIRMMR